MLGRLGLLCLLGAIGAILFKEPGWIFAQFKLESTCRCFPGDDCWPSDHEWANFNKTLGGKLIATVPLGAPCHDSEFGPYDAERCETLRNIWAFPNTHFSTSSSVMAPFFANQSCDIFYKDGSCNVGTYVKYAVAAADASDFQKTIQFTREHNIRLVIRNTGHDYFGKSTGAGALAIWTSNMKDSHVVDYASGHYKGKAIKVGAGVHVSDAMEAARKENLIVVGGNCGSVGLAGGYTQGGGHGQLTSKFGLAADQVLEWEVVTGTGKLVTASKYENEDLYWALSGGGGGTYGAVVSMTSKLYPEIQAPAANLTFTAEGVSMDTFYEAVEDYVRAIPSMLDAQAASIWLLFPGFFYNAPTVLLGGTKEQLDGMFAPILRKLDENKIKYAYSSDDFPTFYDSYQQMTPPSNVTDFQLGGRLIPRSVIDSDSKRAELMSAFRAIGEKNAVISGVSVEASEKSDNPGNSVNTAWRDASISVVLGTPYDYTNMELMRQNQRLMTEKLQPLLDNLTPGGGCYLSEADFNQPDWKTAFYGKNYDKLRKIKAKWDPENIFYALTGVGSDYWIQESDGRLCKA